MRLLRYLLTIAVLGLLVSFAWTLDRYATGMLTRMLIIGLLAVSVALLTGVAGLPTLGQTAPFLVGAYTTAIMVTHDITVGLWHLLASAGTGAAFALVTAPLVVYARGVVVLMITLALGELTSTIAGQWKSLTHGTDGLTSFADIQPLPGLVDLDTDASKYLYTLAVVGVLVAVVLLVLRSPAGALLRATRDDARRMRASGHPVAGYLTVAYVAAGALAGVAGALLFTVQSYVSPGDGGFDVAALILLAVVIGGATSMVGALVGAGLVVGTRDWIAEAGHAPLLLGLLFIACVYLLPNGLLGEHAALSSLGRLGRRRPPPRIPAQRGPLPSEQEVAR
ncbi:branched-chain amino acid ABC transporter permease [Dactylosporangium matsuzakiense]|uniref:Branched-chain amino acid ABC transporter permease n=1 Tax=Dactylosporangium matsuzakiense TaxID=53360 RepID=A0A9W6KKE2_9ACTN|nr:branched-chain amino acid ABC transporter permease [Dactylosporangium matsuzakiense]UWZ46801.1 branched-chain amino acid ABC transporter permease [Dactylosporangium matsuzakiense]GLL01775.1 branched-chain amino acid ABC transporter permease [Dactylosporangium matsuzakiense]